jgi:hypothetical protein
LSTHAVQSPFELSKKNPVLQAVDRQTVDAADELYVHVLQPVGHGRQGFLELVVSWNVPIEHLPRVQIVLPIVAEYVHAEHELGQRLQRLSVLRAY